MAKVREINREKYVILTKWFGPILCEHQLLTIHTPNHLRIIVKAHGQKLYRVSNVIVDEVNILHFPHPRSYKGHNSG